jgi:hypothetical protein
VLVNTGDKSYARLADAFELTCQQRFGVTRDVPLCKDDKHADRSAALAELVADETEAARRAGTAGPFVLLQDQRELQGSLGRMAWLFTPHLSALYERRQWSEIAWFESHSAGARLISAMVLGPARPNEVVAAAEAGEVARFHDDRVRFLRAYLIDPKCNGDCRARLVDFMLTFYAEAEGGFDEALRELLTRPRVEVASTFSRLNSRLLLCQVSPEDAAALRDRVLVPVLAQALQQSRPDLDRLEDVLSLLALTPDPMPQTGDADGPADAARKNWQAALDRARSGAPEQFRHIFVVRRAAARASRSKPSPALRKALFCTAAEVAPAEFVMDDE